MAGRLIFGVAGFLLGVAVTLLLKGEDAERRAPAGRDRDAATVPRPDAGGARASTGDGSDGSGGPERHASGETAEPPPRDVTKEAERYLAQINGAPSWREALGIVGRMVADLPPEVVRDLMQAIYREITDIEKRKQILKPFVFGKGHPYALDVLHLAATDPAMEVRGWAYGYLKTYALIDFSEDPSAYEAWHRQNEGLPLADALRQSLRAFADRLRGADDEAYAKAMRQFRADDRIHRAAGVDVAAVLLDANMATWFVDKLSRTGEAQGAPGAAAQTGAATLDWLLLADPEGDVVRPYVERVLADPDPQSEAANGAIRALGQIKKPWAFDSLLGLLKRPLADPLQSSIGIALGEQGDKRAVPWLIAAMASGETAEKVYGFGYFGLGKLTGVTWDESHDAKWWLAWWDKNRDQFAPEIRALDPRALRVR
ncbi:MAG TPA: hypothetical protein VFY93_02035 [Planctomycetota bacterium]|nr:hypothetical protein [Planctomycetota bacterium]